MKQLTDHADYPRTTWTIALDVANDEERKILVDEIRDGLSNSGTHDANFRQFWEHIAGLVAGEPREPMKFDEFTDQALFLLAKGVQELAKALAAEAPGATRILDQVREIIVRAELRARLRRNRFMESQFI